MHIRIQKIVLFLALVLLLVIVEPVAAQEDDPLPCGGDSVSGTVVAVDEETGTITLDTDTGLCTVMLDGEYEHPVVGLLGTYFGDVSVEDLIAALETTQGCAVHDPDSDTWAWTDCDADGAVPATVTAENEDGTFTITTTVNGEQVTVTVTVDDPATTENLSDALEALAAEGWELDEDGNVLQVGDEIAAYHEDGIGFGVLAKLYAMAAELQEACAAQESDEACAVTVAELVEAFQSGMGMGELFKEYGKPAILGIGHVKQQNRERERVRESGNGPPPHAGPKDERTFDTPPYVESEDGQTGGPPPHAGPKDDHTGGPPPHAGPKKPKKDK